MFKMSGILPALILGCLLTSGLGAQSWEQLSPLNVPRYGAASVVLNGSIYVLGGATTLGQPINSVERYDSATATWDTLTTPFSIPRVNPSATVFDGKIYLAGGQDLSGTVLDEVEIFDPSSGSWSFGERMRKERRGHVLVSIRNSIAAFCGLGDDNEYEDDVEYYDLDRQRWEDSSTPLPSLRTLPFAASVNDTYYMFGGIFNFPIASGYSATVEANWDMTWTQLPDLQENRGYGATVVSGQRIFMIGGTNSTGPSSRVSFYDIGANAISDSTPLPQGLVGATAVNLDGRIYVMGGYSTDPNTPHDTVLRLDNTVGIFNGRGPGLPGTFALMSGYPNPFNGEVHLRVDISQPVRDAELQIFDIRGVRVATLYEGQLLPGRREFAWAGQNERGEAIASGIYLAVLRIGPGLQTVRLSYVK
ncbi:MAG: hypothetical protein KDI06_04700 [Calditrichaeota bacterium]|nr:hypothetical protein [Calditrichota bacterium]HQU72805.1 kelch repeat-containing protein [Calditrichia bacterium]